MKEGGPGLLNFFKRLAYGDVAETPFEEHLPFYAGH
jgi:hypothetical protein